MTATELKKWRQDRKITQEQAALLLGVKIDRWRKWEQGINPIPSLLVSAMPQAEAKRGAR